MEQDDPDTLLHSDPVRVRVAFCKCGHGLNEHRHDLKNVGCGRGGCGCKMFREGRVLYRVTAWMEP